MRKSKGLPRQIPAPFAPKRPLNAPAEGTPRAMTAPAHPPVRTRTTVRRIPPR
jgi:hypothetical protein